MNRFGRVMAHGQGGFPIKQLTRDLEGLTRQLEGKLGQPAVRRKGSPDLACILPRFKKGLAICREPPLRWIGVDVMLG